MADEADPGKNLLRRIQSEIRQTLLADGHSEETVSKIEAAVAKVPLPGFDMIELLYRQARFNDAVIHMLAALAAGEGMESELSEVVDRSNHQLQSLVTLIDKFGDFAAEASLAVRRES